MRLDEISLTHARQLARTKWTGINAVVAWLERAGFHRLGRGRYGQVFTDDHRAVVKVFAEDICYARFVEFCKKHRGNPHLPRITKVYHFDRDSGVVFMELLQPLNTADAEQIAEDMNDYLGERLKHLRGQSYRESDHNFDAFFSKYPALADLIDDLAMAFAIGPCRTDIFVDNLMARGDTPVLIDPVH